MALLRREVRQRAGEQGREGAVEVGRGGSAAGATDLQVAGDGEVEVEGQAVGPGGDRCPDVSVDEGPALDSEPLGEMGLAVLGRQVSDQVLASGVFTGTGRGDGPGGPQSGPGDGAGPVELSVEARVGPLQAAAPGEDEERAGHEPDQPLQEPLKVAVAVRGVLEGVQQDHRRHRLLRGQPAQVPGQKMRVVRQGFQVRGGLQQGRGPCGARKGLGALVAFAQCGDQG
ncbi:hypothetical protein [Streptomyces atratus]|uniref:hypothetical protein n=1 Tax=Streptomyces atratus TaxID=1893 RepID=UPI00224DCAD0|nr:hypothetical protein [Streptomyces atratus]MCX5346083.1 hypothetical protein [Streptomyces atratus]